MAIGKKMGGRSTASSSIHQLVTGVSLSAGRQSKNADRAVVGANRVDAKNDMYSKDMLDRLRRLCVLCGKTATYHANSKNFCYSHREDALREHKAWMVKKYGKQ